MRIGGTSPKAARRPSGGGPPSGLPLMVAPSPDAARRPVSQGEAGERGYVEVSAFAGTTIEGCGRVSNPPLLLRGYEARCRLLRRHAPRRWFLCPWFDRLTTNGMGVSGGRGALAPSPAASRRPLPQGARRAAEPPLPTALGLVRRWRGMASGGTWFDRLTTNVRGVLRCSPFVGCAILRHVKSATKRRGVRFGGRQGAWSRRRRRCGNRRSQGSENL